MALVTAACRKIIAAGPKVTAIRPLMRQWKIAGNGNQRAIVLISAWQWDRTEQGLRIGVLHFVEHIFNTAGLNRLAGIHHADPVAGFQNQAKIVRNEQHRSAVFFT